MTAAALFHNFAATTGNIEGKVIDDFGDPFPGANVFIPGTTIGAATNANGDFHISNIPAGVYNIRVSSIPSSLEITDVSVGLFRNTTKVTFVLTLGAGPTRWVNTLPVEANERKLTVCWLGIEAK